MIVLSKTCVSKPLTIRELAEFNRQYLVVYGLTHRAMTHAAVWAWEARDSSLSHTAEVVLDDIFNSALRDTREWLEEMKSEGTPFLYSQDALVAGLRELFDEVQSAFLSINDQGDVTIAHLIEQFMQADFDFIAAESEWAEAEAAEFESLGDTAQAQDVRATAKREG